MKKQLFILAMLASATISFFPATSHALIIAGTFDKDILHEQLIANEWGTARPAIKIGLIDVNAQNHINRTPLHYAAELGNLGLVKFLIKNGASVDAQDLYHISPIHKAACCTSPYRAIKSLRWYKYAFNIENTYLYCHPKSRQSLLSITKLYTVEYLITSGADVNTKTIDGLTPLYGVITNYDQSIPVCPDEVRIMIARSLIRSGADIDAQDHKGHTPLHWAIYNGDLLITKFLVEAGANMDIPDQNGYTSRDTAKHIIDLIKNNHGEDIFPTTLKAARYIKSLV